MPDETKDAVVTTMPYGIGNVLGDNIGEVMLIDHMGNDQRVVQAARVSYLSTSKGEEKDNQLIHFLMQEGHLGPFEHVMFTFLIKCPLFVRSQWMLIS